MSKRKPIKRGKGPQTQNHSAGRGSVITFGAPEPILTTGTEYYNIQYDLQADHWRLPIDRLALAQLPNLNSQHGGGDVCATKYDLRRLQRRRSDT
ncbi:Uncharacterised protein [Klebsiella michiganensis]|uniref:Uncharacterized protein n=1 Tax=Klebsiella michiganensis TaxID=1134687 RepID=A0A7H4MYN3_9ENTR|nr:Uncharacterised protein [Klebsiella michiganensis]